MPAHLSRLIRWHLELAHRAYIDGDDSAAIRNKARADELWQRLQSYRRHKSRALVAA